MRRTCSLSALPDPATARFISAGVASGGMRMPGLGEREKQNTARLSEGDEALGIHARKDTLDGGRVRPIGGDDLGESAVQEEEALGERAGPGRADDPGVDEGGRGGEVDDGPARRPASGVRRRSG